MGVYLGSNKVGVTVNASGGGGGSSSGQKQINFIDYDGTIVESYSKNEWRSVTALPDNPSHSGLIAQGWNWTKAQIDAQLTSAPDSDVWVGQMYITESGDTEIDVEMQEGRLSPIMTIAVNGTVTIDWGDNTTPDTVTGTSLTTRLAPTHTYSSAGSYTIKIHVVSGSFRFYTDSSNSILRKNTNLNQNRVYSNCIREVRIGTGITEIYNYMFGDCYSLTSITIPNTVTSILSNAFTSCYSLKSVTIPNTVIDINNSAFQYCYSLTSITIPNTVTYISNNTFQYCYSLTSITIPNTVTSIFSSVFGYCYSLASITIPNTVTSISSSAFSNCSSLANITIPDTVTSISSNIFQYCSSLANITIPDTVTSISNYAFQYCSSLKNITIPDTVTSISSYAFQYCSSLKNITIPDTVTSISNYAFRNCSSLASITIPNTVTSIGNNVFSNCYGMAEYHFKSTTPPTLGTGAFSGISSDCIIYVPSASLSDYQGATNWSTYASYMQGE